MLIGMISDTHDQLQRTKRATALLKKEGIDALIHCGDLTRPEIVFECALGVPSYFVFGNNDDDRGELKQAIETIGGVCLGEGGLVTLEKKKIAITHGHLAREIRRLESASADFLLYGHTHAAADDLHGSTRWINPGALHRASEWTVALLDLKTAESRFVKVQ
ncbi:MAG: metallophosphoesterase [Isosphaeraceae bacterium]